MKRLHFVLAALLVLPVFFSCDEKPEPDPIPTPPPTPVDPVTPPEPEPVPIEFRRTIRFDNNIVSANSSNDYVAVYKQELVLTKSGDPRQISTGSYTFDQKTKAYDLKDFGKLEILSDTKVAFTPVGGSRKEYSAKMTEIVSDEKSDANIINRSWTIKETILRMDSRGVNYTYEGLDLNKVEKDARDLGIEFKYHMDDGMVVSKVIITDALLAASFKNGQAYAAEHTLGASGGKFNLSEYTNGLEGTATVQFIDEMCVITIDTSLDESEAKIILTLVEAK